MASSCFEWCPWVTFLDLGVGRLGPEPSPLGMWDHQGQRSLDSTSLSCGKSSVFREENEPFRQSPPILPMTRSPSGQTATGCIRALLLIRSNLRAWICLATALSSLACHHRGRRTPVAPHTLIRALWRWAHLSASLAVEWNCPRWQFSSLHYWFIWLGSGHWAGHSLGFCLRPSLPVSSKEGPSAITSS